MRLLLFALAVALAGCANRPPAAFHVPDGFEVEAVDPNPEVAFTRNAVTYDGLVYPETYDGVVFQPTFTGIAVSHQPFLYGDNVEQLGLGPDGNLWFQTSTQTYRITYQPGVLQQLYYRRPQLPGILQVTRQPQPTSSWGRRSLEAAKHQIGPQWQPQLATLIRDRAAEPRDRIAALWVLERLGPRPTADLLRPLSQQGNAEIRAAAIQVAARHTSERTKAIVASGLSDVHPNVRRRSLEGMVQMGLTPETADQFAPAGIVLALLGDKDPQVRTAARTALEHYPRSQWAAQALRETYPLAAPHAYEALTRTAANDADLDPLLPLEAELLENPTLANLQLFQFTAARRTAELPPSIQQRVARILTAHPRSADPRVNAEIARVLALCHPAEP